MFQAFIFTCEAEQAELDTWSCALRALDKSSRSKIEMTGTTTHSRKEENYRDTIIVVHAKMDKVAGAENCDRFSPEYFLRN